MKKSRRKIKREQERRLKKGKRSKKKISFKWKWFWYIFALVGIGYCIYVSVLITGIEKNDPLSTNGSSSYLLSGTSFDDLEKTLWIFEKGEGSDSSIEKVFLIASNKEKGLLLNIYIPGWLYFASTENTLGNDISVSNFRYAGDFLEDGRGIEYAIWQFEQMLGTKIDNYIWIGEKEQSLYSKIFGYFTESKDTFDYDSTEADFTQDALLLDSFLSKYFVFEIFKYPRGTEEMGEGILSNRNFVEVLGELSMTKRELGNYEKHLIDLGNTEYLEEELSNSGGMVYYFNTIAYDKSFRKYLEEMLDRELEKEQVKIEVYNGSGISGAAEQMARKIENSGCDVVRYENAPDTIKKTLLYIPDEERFENSIEVVKEVVGSTVEIVNTRPSFMTTGDIVVVLGEDIERMYSF